MSNGDVSRRRRLIGSEAKIAWYAFRRTVRFAVSEFKPHSHKHFEDFDMSMLNEAKKLFSDSEKLNFKDRWSLPFPMGVFGTLREGHGNNRLMHRANIGCYRKAFMPHFIASGLSISFQKDASAPFEVFCYTQQEWNKMIGSVDMLEGFYPPSDEDSKYHSWGYYRTLAWLHILPEDYTHQLYTNNQLGSNRTLDISPEKWNDYERIPAWVYSNRRSNKAATEAGVDTVIWG